MFIPLLAAVLLQAPGMPQVGPRVEQGLPAPSPAQRFWETTTPEQWTPAQAEQLRVESPWAQTAGMRVFLASAEPVRMAEEILRRARTPDPASERHSEDSGEYEDFLRQHPGEHIIVGVHLPNAGLDPSPHEIKEMEKHSRIKLDKRKFPMIAFFPPTPSDPVLRMVFPRKLTGDEKKLVLELYLPGVHRPFRNFEFPLKTLEWKGKPAL